MMFAALLLWAALIALAFWGTSRLFPSTGHRDGAKEGDSPLEIASRRYAKGEITRDDLEVMRRDLDPRVKEQ